MLPIFIETKVRTEAATVLQLRLSIDMSKLASDNDERLRELNLKFEPEDLVAVTSVNYKVNDALSTDELKAIFPCWLKQYPDGDMVVSNVTVFKMIRSERVPTLDKA